MTQFQDHPRRYELANELHARPFPEVDGPGFAVFLAIKSPQDTTTSDRAADRAHLVRLLDRHGADHPTPGATHYFGKVAPGWGGSLELQMYDFKHRVRTCRL